MPKVGIRAYLLLALGTLSVLPTFVLSTITASRASATELERADRDGRARANAVARELDEFMAKQIASIELLAGQVEAAGGLEAPNLQAILSTHRRHSPELGFVYVADRDGTSLSADPPFSSDGTPNAGTSYRDRDYYQELIKSGRTTISRVQLGRRSGVPNVQVVAPIHDGAGQLIGFAEGSIDLHGIAESIAQAVDGSADHRIIVTDGLGRVLADSSRHLPALTDVSDLPVFRAARDGPDVRTTDDDRHRHVRVVTARMRLDLGWTVATLRDQSTVDALADAARRDALVIAGSAMLVALLVVGFGVHWLSKPIRTLAAAAKAVGRGDFSHPVPPPRALEAHEIADLLVSVRDMTRDVHRSRDATTALITKLETVNDELSTMVVGIEHAGNAIEVVDAGGRLTYVNAAWEKFTGYTPAEAVGRSFFELLAIDRACFDEMWAQATRGISWRGVYPSHRRDGKPVDVELDVVPVVRPDGAVSHFVATRIDKSEQRRAEEVLRMNDRLAAVGTMAAGVAHEINNPLTYVTGNLAYLRGIVASLESQLPSADFEDALAAFEATDLGVARVTAIVRDLRQLSRPDERTTTSIDLNALLDSCVRMTSVELRHRATVECNYAEISPIHGNEARLSQVFINLLINAAHACDSGNAHTANVVRITTRSAPDDSHVIVEISDTGVGIAPEVIEHIFDAFFTTKPIGVGTGLGLSICHGIVTQLGGTITVTSTPGLGSTFRVTLPVVLAAPAPTAASSVASTVTAARVKILVVDDEPSITQSLSRMLRDHDVTVASSATEAFDLLVAAPFDVVLSDIMMPEVDGFELYRRACAVRAGCETSFIFMTGGIVQPHLLDELARLRPPCLYKPFTRAQVLDAIAKQTAPAERPIAEPGADRRS